MLRSTFFLPALALVTILAQWFVFVSIRRYVWKRYYPISRRVAYPALAFLLVCNHPVLKIVLDSTFFPWDVTSHRTVLIAYYSYFASILLLFLFFSFLRLAERVIGLFMAHETAPRVFSPGVPAGPPDTDHSRRAFFKLCSATGLAATAGMVGYGVVQAYSDPVVETHEVILPGLKGMGRPLTVIQVADFHYGRLFGNAELERVVDTLNSIEADALVILGDVFHSYRVDIRPAVPILRRLIPRKHGNFAVLGNHDFYSGEQLSDWALRASRLTILRNQWVSLQTEGGLIHLGGIDDPRADWLLGKSFPEFPIFMYRVPKTPGSRVLLSHRPNILPLAERWGIDLVLAGHIHGGQIVMPVPGVEHGLSLAQLVSDYIQGWYEMGRCRMYVTRGIGLTFVPWRVNCPPEITVLRFNGAHAKSSA